MGFRVAVVWLQLPLRVWGAPPYHSRPCKGSSVWEDLPSSCLCVLLSVQSLCAALWVREWKQSRTHVPCLLGCRVLEAGVRQGMHPSMGPCLHVQPGGALPQVLPVSATPTGRSTVMAGTAIVGLPLEELKQHAGGGPSSPPGHAGTITERPMGWHLPAAG